MSRNGKWCEIIVLVSNSIERYIKPFPQMISLNNFHNMESSIESWRFCARSLFDLLPPTPVLDGL